MRRRVVVDTGPLVAFLNKRDKHHEWAVSQWAEIEAPPMTCESVLSEACFLLRRSDVGPLKVMDLLCRRVLTVPFRVEEEARLLQKLMSKYADVPDVARGCPPGSHGRKSPRAAS